MLQFVCECDVVKDTGKEEYMRPFIHIGLDWISMYRHLCWLHTYYTIYLFIYLLRPKGHNITSPLQREKKTHKKLITKIHEN